MVEELQALPDAVAEGYERVLVAASAPDYGRDGNAMSGVFQIGSTSITTDNSRDTLLLLAGARLRALAPQRFGKFKETLAKWDIKGPVSIRGMSFGPSSAPPRAPEVMAISSRNTLTSWRNRCFCGSSSTTKNSM